jgi:hypothetical protein
MSTVDYASLICSAIAILISLISVYYSRQRVLLEQRKYRELQAEKARHRLEITIDETIKNESPPFEPCNVWAVKFIATNRSGEQVFLKDVGVELSWRRLHPSAKQLLLEALWRSELYGFSLSFRFTEKGLGSKSSGRPIPVVKPLWDELIHTSTYFINWENEQPIRLTQREWYRGPSPGEKEVWMVYGRLPKDVGNSLSEHDLYLATIKCHFHTDQGIITVFGSYPEVQTVPGAFAERLDQIADTIGIVSTAIPHD